MTFAAPHTLLEMLSYKRPAFSKSEEEFIDRFIRPLGVTEDGYGNLWKKIGTSPIMWSSHTDTVHHEPGRQHISVVGGMAKLSKPVIRKCLGADCSGGVWIMTEMIKAGIPGLYIFHRDEESGGHGSKYIANQHADLLSPISFAIAFDRKGYGDVITHQMGRTASDKFAKQLASILGGKYQPDDTGLFTDTANYASIIPECTNLSIGYFNNHGPMETLDMQFIEDLLDTILKSDFDDLKAYRDPKDAEDDFAWYFEPKTTKELRWYVQDNPDHVADYLEALGITVEDLDDARSH
jgi:hypothetical protein